MQGWVVACYMLLLLLLLLLQQCGMMPRVLDMYPLIYQRIGLDCGIALGARHAAVTICMQRMGLGMGFGKEVCKGAWEASSGGTPKSFESPRVKLLACFCHGFRRARLLIRPPLQTSISHVALLAQLVVVLKLATCSMLRHRLCFRHQVRSIVLETPESAAACSSIMMAAQPT